MDDELTTLIPDLQGPLRAHSVRLPLSCQKATGIRIQGRLIRSIVYTTDIAIIRNCNADAVFAVYPFTPQQIISKAIIEASSIPVFVGVGGGTTNGPRCAMLAHDAEADGAYGIVLNAPVSYATLEMASRVVDIPVTVTVVNSDPEVIENRIAAGASLVHVSAGKDTAKVVGEVRGRFPDLPVIATGGSTEESISATIAAGANAIVCTPPSNHELFSPMMVAYRQEAEVRPTPRNVRPVSDATQHEIEERIHDIRDWGFINR